MKRHILLLFLMVLCQLANAQTYVVDNVEYTPFDITGSTNPQKDKQGNDCALIKIYTTATILNVKGDMVGKMEDRGPIKWVYLKSGTTSIDLILKGQQTLHVMFSKYGIEKLLPKATYLMTLTDELHAQENAIMIFEKGFISYKQKDYLKALEYFSKSAALGYNNAQNNLAWMYEKGLGVEPDLHKAMELYQEAANNGYVSAYCKIGEFYSNGKGVTPDPKKAFDNYMVAAEQKDGYAQYIIGRCYDIGYGVKKNDEQAFRWYKASAEQGNAEGQYCLACCYNIGQGTERRKKDIVEAEFWLKKAAAQGHEKAKKALEMFKK